MGYLKIPYFLLQTLLQLPLGSEPAAGSKEDNIKNFKKIIKKAALYTYRTTLYEKSVIFLKFARNLK